MIDPAIYPELDLYPPVSAETVGIPKTGTCVFRWGPWGVIDLQTGPRVHPWSQVYPGLVSAGQNDVATSRIAPLLQPAYPQFDICRHYYLIPVILFLLYLKDPAVYPCFDIYRADSLKMEYQRVSLSVMLPAQYPALDLCESWHRYSNNAI